MLNASLTLAPRCCGQKIPRGHRPMPPMSVKRASVERALLASVALLIASPALALSFPFGAPAKAPASQQPAQPAGSAPAAAAAKAPAQPAKPAKATPEQK